MCIRDSASGAKALTGGKRPEGKGQFYPPTVLVDVNEGMEAVSYTHLRAHETVLDLVCRLLLEKKKNTTSKTYHRQSK